MNDKEWLEKVSIAYKVYPYPNKEIEAFVRWLYKEYGIVPPKDNHENRI